MDAKSDGDSDDDSGDDWDEVTEDFESIPCLFCNEVTNNTSMALEHLVASHRFDLKNFIMKHYLDTYSYIKLINFIRHKNVLPDQLNALNIKTWESDEYLRPVIKDDPWLMFDIEDLEEKTTKPIAYTVNSENGCVTLSEAHFAELQRTIQRLRAQLEQDELACYLAKQQIDEMVEKAQKLVLDGDLDENNTVSPSGNSNCNVDKGYFKAYSHFAIHHEMLTDKVRTESYRDALLTNANRFSNSVVLDVGCGTGILSMFAAKTGCRKVISVDQSDIIYHAIDIIRENDLGDIITLQKGRLEDINLDEDKVDVILSEWMGYFLLFEGMLDTVIYARDHYLAPGGILLPNRCTLSIVGSGDTRRYVKLIDYWLNVYGFKMSCMKAEAVREPNLEICKVDELITSTVEIQSFDLYKVTKDCVNFSSPFEFKVKKTGSLTAIVGYFDVFFDLDNPVHFSTGPHSSPTHWKQTVFSLSEPISITEGEILRGKLICRRHVTNIRALMVIIHIKNTSQVYCLE
ncbi:Protein arginine N-methyltransferase 3 [Habropoda laboriosa]|uniref:type I protein arginine methyltransferase n=2 Tax=Habropoda laboriosa TaxID=597456 RepID=A0A0L7QQX0_9HYME|nr:Protein arginine N-methyltransferase 3 [Habropoda laboriosa]